MPLQGFIESVEYLNESLNREARTVKQIIIKAGKSKNDRHYPEAVLEKAAFLFEKVQTYRNHPSKKEIKEGEGRRVEDLTGWLSDVYYDEAAKRVVGTRHFTNNTAGRDTFQLVADVIEGKAPANLLGGSINALGRGSRQKDGTMMVESITRVVSVDDVTSPAAGGGFEQLIASAGGIVDSILAEATFEEWCESRPDYMDRVQKDLKLVRQTKAVKSAKANADSLRLEVQEQQAETQRLEAEHEATLAELAKARRELLVVETLNKARGLPAETRKELRERLIDADLDTWDSILEAKAREVKQLGRSGQAATSDMPTRRVAESYKSKTPTSAELARNSAIPTEGEDYATWSRRTSQVN